LYQLQGVYTPRSPGLWCVALVVLLLVASPVLAGPEELLGSKEKFFTPHLGDRVPTELVFHDETGKKVTLGDYGKTKPILLVLAYYRCPMLCTLVLNDVVKGLRGVPFNAGDEFEVVVISFDAREKPPLAKAKKDAYVEEYARPEAEKGWHFLTGEQPEIDRLMEAVGFRAIWDEKQQQFAHARGILVLTGDWMVTRYFLEGTYPPRDLRLALVEASEGRVGSPMDRILLMCFNYNPVTARYSMTVLTVVRMASVVMVALIVGFWVVTWLRGGKWRPTLAVPPTVGSPPSTSPTQSESIVSAGAITGVSNSRGEPGQ
jgi:protein SCO1/2